MSGSNQTETGLEMLMRGPGQQDQSVLQAQLNDNVPRSNVNPMLGSEEQADYMQVRDDQVRNELQAIFDMVYAKLRDLSLRMRGLSTSQATNRYTQTSTLQRTAQDSLSRVDPAVVFEDHLHRLTLLLRTQPGSHRSFVEWATSEGKPYARPHDEQAVEFPVTSRRTGPAAHSDLSLQEVLQSCDGLLPRAFGALKNDERDAALIHLGDIGVKMIGHWDTNLMHHKQANDTRSRTSAIDCPTAAGPRSTSGPSLASSC